MGGGKGGIIVTLLLYSLYWSLLGDDRQSARHPHGR